MSNPSFSNPSIEEYVPKIKIIAEEMARKKHGIENDIEINEMILKEMIEELNKNSISKTTTKNKNSNNINTKNTKTKNMASNSNEKNPALNTNSNEQNENENIDSKLNQGNMSKEEANAPDGKSNIINTNANLNTNQNTYSRLNTYYNINTNNNINNKNDLNNNLDRDENNESNQNSQNNSNSINNSNDDESDKLKNFEKNNKNINIIENNDNIYLNIQENKFNKKNINDNKKEKDEYIEEEIIFSPSFEYSFNDSSDDTNISRSNNINSKSKKLTLYEREMRNREVRNKILEKKREQNIINEVKNLKPYPKMNKNSEKIINNQINYVPIEERAAKIHSMKLAQRIIIEEEKKYQEWKKEMDELYNKKIRSKNFDKEEWDRFIKSQYQWKDEVQYKIRAAQIFRANVYKKYYFKPNISKKSKSIIKDIQKGNDSFIDEVFVRLFNDYEERKERQKFINDNSLPSFKPKISKNSSQKLLYKNGKIPNRCNSNSVMSISKINNSKNDFRNDIYNNFDKNKTRNKNKNKKVPKTRSQNIINGINIHNNEKNSVNNKSYNAIKDTNDKNSLKINNSFINQNGNNKINKKQIENKSQGPTQPTNNTNANNYNQTEMNNDLFGCKYIILENPLVRSFINKNKDKTNSQIKIKPVVPTLPIQENNTIENNCEKLNDSKDQNIYGISQEGQSYFAQSHYDDDEEIKNVKNKIEKKIEDEEKEYDDYYNVDMNQNDEESSNKKLPNDSLQDSNIFEKVESMNNLDKTKKYGRQAQNETLNSDDSKFADNNLYRLNIRESTPLMIKQDVVLPSNEYSDFFNKSEK